MAVSENGTSCNIFKLFFTLELVFLYFKNFKKGEPGKVDGSQWIAQWFDFFKHESSSGYLWML